MKEKGTLLSTLFNQRWTCLVVYKLSQDEKHEYNTWIDELLTACITADKVSRMRMKMAMHAKINLQQTITYKLKNK